MPVKKERLLNNVVLNSSGSSADASINLKGVTPLRVVFYFTLVKTGGAANQIDITPYVSPDEGLTKILYKKMKYSGGVLSSPPLTISSSISGEQLAMSEEDIADWVQLTFAALGTLDASNYYTIDAWVIVAY